MKNLGNKNTKQVSFQELVLLKAQKERTCNLCGKVLRPRNLFERFCAPCKSENEEYIFSEWFSAAG